MRPSLAEKESPEEEEEEEEEENVCDSSISRKRTSSMASTPSQTWSLNWYLGIKVWQNFEIKDD